jgi:hypothetical protein
MSIKKCENIINNLDLDDIYLSNNISENINPKMILIGELKTIYEEFKTIVDDLIYNHLILSKSDMDLIDKIYSYFNSFFVLNYNKLIEISTYDNADKDFLFKTDAVVVFSLLSLIYCIKFNNLYNQNDAQKVTFKKIKSETIKIYDNLYEKEINYKFINKLKYFLCFMNNQFFKKNVFLNEGDDLFRKFKNEKDGSFIYCSNLKFQYYSSHLYFCLAAFENFELLKSSIRMFEIDINNRKLSNKWDNSYKKMLYDTYSIHCKTQHVYEYCSLWFVPVQLYRLSKTNFEDILNTIYLEQVDRYKMSTEILNKILTKSSKVVNDATSNGIKKYIDKKPSNFGEYMIHCSIVFNCANALLIGHFNTEKWTTQHVILYNKYMNIKTKNSQNAIFNNGKTYIFQITPISFIVYTSKANISKTLNINLGEHSDGNRLTSVLLNEPMDAIYLWLKFEHYFHNKDYLNNNENKILFNNEVEGEGEGEEKFEIEFNNNKFTEC